MLGRSLLLATAGVSSKPFGVKYANPAVLPTGNPTGVSFSPAGDAVIVTHNTFPFITAYSWSAAGFGAKYANPSTALNSTPNGLTHTGAYVLTLRSVTNSSELIAYQWSSASGFGAREAISISNTFLPQGIEISPSGYTIAIAGTDGTTLKPLQIIGINQDREEPEPLFYSLGTMPGTIAAAAGRSVAWSPSGSHVALVGTNMGIAVFPYNVSTGTLGSPFTGGVGGVSTVQFTTPGNVLAWGGTTQEIFRITNWSSAGFGSNIETPPVSIFGGINSIRFSPLNNLLAIGCNDSAAPLRVFQWTGTSVGSQLGNPDVLPTGVVADGRGIAFSPSGNDMVVCHQNPPYIIAYKIT
jgi:WD40 repeat protein